MHLEYKIGLNKTLPEFFLFTKTELKNYKKNLGTNLKVTNSFFFLN